MWLTFPRIIFTKHVVTYKTLMCYLSSTKTQDDLSELYNGKQKPVLERWILVYPQLQGNGHFSEALYYNIPIMIKVQAVNILYGCIPK